MAGTSFRCRFQVDGRVVSCGFTTDLARREREQRRKWPTGRIEPVGGPATREEAWKWERQQAEHRFRSAS